MDPFIVGTYGSRSGRRNKYGSEWVRPEHFIQLSLEYCPLHISRAKIVDGPQFVGFMKGVAVVVNSVLN